MRKILPLSTAQTSVGADYTSTNELFVSIKTFMLPMQFSFIPTFHLKGECDKKKYI